MPNFMTSAQLLDGIKLRTFQPEDQTTFTDSEILNIAWEEMTSVIMPILIGSGANLFATTFVASKNSKSRIRLPGDVCGARLYSVKLLDSGEEREIPQVSPFDAKQRLPGRGFYLENGEIVLVNCDNFNGSIVVSYPHRPGRFQLASDTTLRVPAYVGGVGYFEAPSAIGDIFPTIDPLTNVEQRINFQLSTSPFTIIPAEVKVSALVGYEYCPPASCRAERRSQFESTEFQEGDMAIADNTCYFVPLPTECFDWLIQRAALRMLEYQGKQESIQRMQDKLADMEANMKALYSPRSSGNPKIIGQTNDLLGGY